MISFDAIYSRNLFVGFVIFALGTAITMAVFLAIRVRQKQSKLIKEGIDFALKERDFSSWDK